ncbi:C2H2 type zinc finger domain-containing protein 10 [Elsinoe australis]|uniref:C2H2 type zinc finger domain-containing protein 10 n=1 Tax=Elsinoe australis TaxID=40998 RepID=A0A4U7AQG7_9PEZI|nr:C2H2 type zinc finger domain-containing protein 10 [Elsinoe australis]
MWDLSGLEFDSAPELMTFFHWTCLTDLPNYKHPNHARLFPDKDALSALYAEPSLEFAPGLLEALQSDTPPPLSWFENLPSSCPKNKWGWYVVPMRKDGCEPRAYWGSGTKTDGGVGNRMKVYAEEKGLLPQRVRESLDEGYEITHIGLLGTVDIPGPALAPALEVFCLGVEAVFTWLFWGLWSKTTGYGAGTGACLWPVDTLEYGGLCTHSAFIEPGCKRHDLTAEELEAAAQVIKGRKLVAAAARGRRYRKRKADVDPEFYANRWTASVKKHAGEYRCETCNITFCSKEAMTKHLASDSAAELHAAAGVEFASEAERTALKATMKRSYDKRKEEDRYRCDPCDHTFANKLRFDEHNANPAFAAIHLAAENGEPPKQSAYRCRACNRGFSTKYSHRNHMDNPRFKPIHDKFNAAETASTLPSAQ